MPADLAVLRDLAHASGAAAQVSRGAGHVGGDVHDATLAASLVA